MKTFIKLLLLTLVAMLCFQYSAAQDPMPKKQGTTQEYGFASRHTKVKKARAPRHNAPGRDVVTNNKMVCEGTTQNQYAPIYTNYSGSSNGTATQMIYPADVLDLDVPRVSL